MAKTEDEFPDDELTLLVLRDVTLFGNSEELKKFERDLVLATQARLLRDGYAVINHPKRGKGGPLRGDDSVAVPAPGRAKLTDKGSQLFARLQHKLGA